MSRIPSTSNHKPVVCSIHPKITGKSRYGVKLAQKCWVPVETTVEHFVSMLTDEGKAFAARFHGGARKNDNFLGTTVFALDFDGKYSLDEGLADPFILDNAAFFYTTLSHRLGIEDRFRVGFVADREVTDADEYREVIGGLLERYPQADQVCKDPARFFYGCRDAAVVRTFPNLYRLRS